VPCPTKFAPGGGPLLISTVVSGRGYNVVRFFALLMLLVGIGPGYWKMNASLFQCQVPALQRRLHLVFGTVYWNHLHYCTRPRRPGSLVSSVIHNSSEVILPPLRNVFGSAT